jgi:nicotinate-nucleotide adenylyltransferase
MRVGVFGGCFNPVHVGHLSLIEEVLTRFELEKVLVVPNMNPYYKEHKKVSFDLISKMINLAIDDKWNCEISTLESDTNKDYTTYETLRVLAEDNVNNELYLILGSDQFLQFSNWKNSDEIKDKINLIIALRDNYNINIEDYIDKNIHYSKLDRRNRAHIFKSNNDKELIFYDLIKKFDISSSVIRKMLSLGAVDEVEQFLTPRVLNFILEKGLYR